MSLAQQLPWWGKLGAKLVLSRLPIPYRVWRRLAVFRHGDMQDPRRAIAVFREHVERARRFGDLPPDFTMMELGPGDSLLSAGVARAFGARGSILIDAGPFASRDPDGFAALDRELANQGLARLDLPQDQGFGPVMSALGARYLTEGLASMKTVPDASVDLIWSSVVLEHVLRAEFAPMAAEMRRVLKPTGVMSHSIDLRDHLGGSLNNLRFSQARWESPRWRSAGFYTNRLSQAEILEIFKDTGFDYEVLDETRWPNPPVKRETLAAEFQGRSDEALTLAEFDVVLWPSHG